MQLSWPCSQFWWCSTKRLELVICGVSWDLGRFISWGWTQLCCSWFKAASGIVQLYMQGTFSKLVKHAKLEPGWHRLDELLSERWTLSLSCTKAFPKDLCSVFNPIGYYLTFFVGFSIALQSYNRKIPFLCALNLMCNISSLPYALPPLELFSSARFHM